MTQITAILAGGGAIPNLVSQAAKQRDETVKILSFTGQPQPENLQADATIPLGSVSKIIAQLHAWNVQNVVLIGNLNKPNVLSALWDAKARELLANLSLKHDDALLRAATQVLEKEGFKIRAATSYCPNIIMPKGTLTKAKPSAQQLEDIKRGFEILATLGNADVGQSIIMQNGVVLGIEAIEGTDELINRCKSYTQNPGAILVKSAKPNQLQTADLPTVGLETLKNLHKNNYAGLALQAKKGQIIDQAEMVKFANKNGLFIYGA